MAKLISRSLLLAALMLPACSSSSGGGATALDATLYTGTWTGTWTNTTFSSTGAVTVTVTENAGAFTFQFDMDGNVFGGSNPAPESFMATINANDATLNAATSGVYGSLTGTLNGNGSLTINGTAIPGSVDRVALTGNWSPTTITANVTITFDSGATANGNATLTKQ